MIIGNTELRAKSVQISDNEKSDIKNIFKVRFIVGVRIVKKMMK